MTKQDYLNDLKAELSKNAVTDAAEVISEYEQHFLFKLADGFTEEEIAAKLGSPAQIALQFAGIPSQRARKGGKKALLVLWLSIIGVFELLLYGAFFVFIIGLFAGSLVPAALGIELLAGVNFMNILPPMPYCGAILLGIALVALGVMIALFAFYCMAYLRQMIRASLRWRRNWMNDEALPLLPMSPQLAPKTRRVLRTILLWAVLIFAMAFIAGFVVLALYTHSLGFWHALGWFGYPATLG